MLNKLNDLSFVIGVFFTTVSIILFGNMLFNGMQNITLFTASVFLVFGIAMMFSQNKKA